MSSSRRHVHVSPHCSCDGGDIVHVMEETLFM